MTNALTTLQQAEAISKKGYEIGHKAGNLQKGAEGLLESARICTKLTDNKRKAYIREARKDLKLAADLFTKGAGIIQQAKAVHPAWFFQERDVEIASKWLARADHCLALVNNSKHS
jgi:hypothetical protein